MMTPLVVATDWGTGGAFALGVLYVVIALGALLYWRILRRANLLSLGRLSFAVAAALAVAWVAPVLFSSDVYAYAAYGELARMGFSPYVHPTLFQLDPLVAAARYQWGTSFPICLYGPVFVGIAELLVRVTAPLGMFYQLESLRAAASAAFLACVPLAYAAFPGTRSERLAAAATIGMNPVAIWCAAEGHNDALALAVVLGGFALVQRRVIGIGAGLVAFSALIKPPGILAAIALAIVERRARLGAAAGIAATIVISLPLIAAAAFNLAPNGHYAPQASLQALLAPLSPIAAVTLAILAAGWLAARGHARLRAQSNEGWIWLALALWVLVPNPYPWYALWLLAVAALAPRSRPGLAAIAFSFSSLLRYIPDAVGTPNAAGSILLGVAASLPLILLL